MSSRPLLLYEDYSREYYEKECKDKLPHMLSPCNAVKGIDVVVDVAQAVKFARLALERMGYETKPWMEFVENG